MMTQDTANFIRRAQADEVVYITDVRQTYAALAEPERQTLRCELEMLSGTPQTTRNFDLHIPDLDRLNPQEQRFVQNYVYAEVYNILSALGGVKMTVYVPSAYRAAQRLAESLNTVFDIHLPRQQRSGYGRCINVIERIADALAPVLYGHALAPFHFEVKASALPLPSKSEREKEKTPSPPPASPLRTGNLGEATANLQNRLLCGIDIGGTSIKVIAVAQGRIQCFKEYDWFPAAFQSPQEMIEPVCLLARLMRASVSLDMAQDLPATMRIQLENLLECASPRSAPANVILQTALQVEQALGKSITGFDAIGVGFPDVVIRDKIVGGETYKTRGMRLNPAIDYEKEFARLTHLDRHLQPYCRAGGLVRMSNDGHIAAFDAGVEMAASGKQTNGMMAHTIGTEFGTGWVDATGQIPELPLECYNFIIDLGSEAQKAFPPDDLRSINNFNTGLAGTLQKYTSQSGMFRLALKHFPSKRPDLYQELVDKGFVVEKQVSGQTLLLVPTEPEDKRKAFLRHLLTLPSREQEETPANIFREIGEYLAITCCETQRILGDTPDTRFLFGGCVTNACCYDFILQGAQARTQAFHLEVADSTLAHTPLMKQLEADPRYAVAQFALAIGAAYYGNWAIQSLRFKEVGSNQV